MSDSMFAAIASTPKLDSPDGTHIAAMLDGLLDGVRHAANVSPGVAPGATSSADARGNLLAAELRSFERKIDALIRAPGFATLTEVCLEARLLSVALCDAAVFGGQGFKPFVEQFAVQLQRCGAMPTSAGELTACDHDSPVAAAIRNCSGDHERELAEQYGRSIRRRAHLTKMLREDDVAGCVTSLMEAANAGETLQQVAKSLPNDYRTHFILKSYAWLCVPLAKANDELLLEHGDYERCIDGHSRIADSVYKAVVAARDHRSSAGKGDEDGAGRLSALSALLEQYRRNVVDPLCKLAERIRTADRPVESFRDEAEQLIKQVQTPARDVLSSALKQYREEAERIRRSPLLPVEVRSDGECWTAAVRGARLVGQGESPQEALDLLGEVVQAAVTRTGGAEGIRTAEVAERGPAGVLEFAPCDMLPSNTFDLDVRFDVRIARYAPEMNADDYALWEDVCEALELNEYRVLLKPTVHDEADCFVALAVDTGAVAQADQIPEAIDLLLLGQVAAWRRKRPQSRQELRSGKPKFTAEFEAGRDDSPATACLPWRLRRRVIVRRSQ